jgi:uncharacterized membrane protein YesL
MSSKGAGLIKTVFNTDNVVMRISEKVLDLVTVNLLFVLSCLPVLTIGIAKISLYQTVFAIKHQRRLPVIRTYINAFHENWKIGLQLGSLELLIAGICLFDLLLFWSQTVLPMQALKAVCLGLFIFLVLVMLAAYPIAARYQLESHDCDRAPFSLVLRHGGCPHTFMYGSCKFGLILPIGAYDLFLVRLFKLGFCTSWINGKDFCPLPRIK